MLEFTTKSGLEISENDSVTFLQAVYNMYIKTDEEAGVDIWKRDDYENPEYIQALYDKFSGDNPDIEIIDTIIDEGSKHGVSMLVYKKDDVTYAVQTGFNSSSTRTFWADLKQIFSFNHGINPKGDGMTKQVMQSLREHNVDVFVGHSMATVTGMMVAAAGEHIREDGKPIEVVNLDQKSPIIGLKGFLAWHLNKLSKESSEGFYLDTDKKWTRDDIKDGARERITNVIPGELNWWNSENGILETAQTIQVHYTNKSGELSGEITGPKSQHHYYIAVMDNEHNVFDGDNKMVMSNYLAENANPVVDYNVDVAKMNEVGLLGKIARNLKFIPDKFNDTGRLISLSDRPRADNKRSFVDMIRSKGQIEGDDISRG